MFQEIPHTFDWCFWHVSYVQVLKIGPIDIKSTVLFARHLACSPYSYGGEARMSARDAVQMIGSSAYLLKQLKLEHASPHKFLCVCGAR
ncbi:hypothetical protein TRP8649_01410 [Pelagimonas phthalicica]|uniref:Uncharacterized protein n=1 Tax=Pelagimonas phthalicica TaxID=1037362 RepID=A0A238JAY4_9RHOB|nr:hypothetical protein CLV87_0662 [Pelagimonas phthalicica]SMX27307.1 hypothetical protein TRP8649_01410 [Pelagimonas phthalicica]